MLSSNTTLGTVESRGWRKQPCNWDESPALLCSAHWVTRGVGQKHIPHSSKWQRCSLPPWLHCICYPALIRGLCQILQFSFNEESDTSKHLNYSAHNYRGWYGDFITVWKGIVIAETAFLGFKIILIWPTVKYIMSNFTRSSYRTCSCNKRPGIPHMLDQE